MVRDEIALLHANRLEEMCSQLGISVESYFDWASRYGHPFASLVFEALHDHLTLLDLARDRAAHQRDDGDDIVVELLQLEG